jgi:cob(I)alamin adenosyltransferase
MLFTGSGDDGTTKTFGCAQRVSKSSAIAEALGTLDEINSLLGLCKIKSYESGFEFSGRKLGDIVGSIQQNLFIIQAEFAGAEKNIEKAKVIELEEMIKGIEKELPPIRTFFISGGAELAAMFDFARTVSRRAERRAVAAHEALSAEVSSGVESKRLISVLTLAYLNRLSSALYALARLSNHKSGINEEPPSYK